MFFIFCFSPRRMLLFIMKNSRRAFCHTGIFILFAILKRYAEIIKHSPANGMKRKSYHVKITARNSANIRCGRALYGICSRLIIGIILFNYIVDVVFRKLIEGNVGCFGVGNLGAVRAAYHGITRMDRVCRSRKR